MKNIRTVSLITTALALVAGAVIYLAQGQPIQPQLDVIKPGDVLIIPAGNYNEALTLKVSGTKELPIILRCETPLACTITAPRPLSTSGHVGYYIP